MSKVIYAEVLKQSLKNHRYCTDSKEGDWFDQVMRQVIAVIDEQPEAQ